MQRWQDPEFPEILRRAREWGALLACADESGRAAPSGCGHPRSPLKKSGRRTQLASGGAAAHSKHRYWPVARSWESVLPPLRARRSAAHPSSTEPKTFSTGS